MAENITTLSEKWQKQQQDHPEWTPALEDILYVNHGDGSDRDRLYSLEQVRNLIQSLFTSLHVSNHGVIETNITPGNVKTYGGDGFEARLQGGGLLRLGGNGISVYSTNGDTETLLGSILWDRKNNRFNVTGAFKGSDIEASGKFILAGWSFEKTQHGDLILYGNDGNTRTAVLKVYNGGNIELLRYVEKTNNVILVTEDMVRLTENPYSSLQIGTMIVLVNDRASGDVTVITNDVGFTDVISVGRFHTYVKGTSGWKTQEL